MHRILVQFIIVILFLTIFFVNVLRLTENSPIISPEIIDYSRITSSRRKFISNVNCSKYEHLGISFFNPSKTEEDSGISEPFRELSILVEPNNMNSIHSETFAAIAIISSWYSSEVRDWV